MIQFHEAYVILVEIVFTGWGPILLEMSGLPPIKDEALAMDVLEVFSG